MTHIISSVVGILVFLAFICSVIYGYVNNIISLVTQAEPMGMVVGRALGIVFAPIGIVLGYF